MGLRSAFNSALPYLKGVGFWVTAGLSAASVVINANETRSARNYLEVHGENAPKAGEANAQIYTHNLNIFAAALALGKVIPPVLSGASKLIPSLTDIAAAAKAGTGWIGTGLNWATKAVLPVGVVASLATSGLQIYQGQENLKEASSIEDYAKAKSQIAQGEISFKGAAIAGGILIGAGIAAITSPVWGPPTAAVLTAGAGLTMIGSMAWSLWEGKKVYDAAKAEAAQKLQPTPVSVLAQDIIAKADIGLPASQYDVLRQQSARPPLMDIAMQSAIQNIREPPRLISEPKIAERPKALLPAPTN